MATDTVTQDQEFEFRARAEKEAAGESAATTKPVAVTPVAPERASEAVVGGAFRTLSQPLVPLHAADREAQLQRSEDFGRAVGLSFDEMVQAVKQYMPGSDHEAATKAVHAIAERKALLPALQEAAGEVAAAALPYGAAGKVATAGNAALKAQVVKQMLGAAAATMATQPVQDIKNLMEEKGKQGATAGATVATLGAAGAGISKVAPPVAAFIKDVVGSKQEILQARGKAEEIAKGELQSNILRKEAEAKRQEVAAKTLEAARQRLDAQASKAATTDPKTGKPIPTLHDTGTAMHEAVNSTFDAQRAARAKAADLNFNAVLQAAGKKEAGGARVDTKGIEAELLKLKALGEGDSKMEHAVDDMLRSVQGRPSEELKAAGVPQGKTMAELELTRRKLNDIAYSGPLEGYGSTVKKAARDAVQTLDKKMQEFLPEFKQYKEQYAADSRPLDAANTRLGKLLTGTSGGLKGEAYAATAKQALPARLLGTRDGQEMLTDMLAGGKPTDPGVTVEARAKAQSLVDKYTENWILEDTRGKTGAAALEHLDKPGVRAAVSPAAQSSLTQRFSSRAAMEQASKDLAGRAAEAQKAAGKARESMRSIAQDVSNAEYLSQRPDYHSRQEALKGYMLSLDKLHDAGELSEGKWRAAHDLVSRATSLEEKTAKARRLVVGVARLSMGGAGLIWGAKEISGAMQH